MRGEVIWNPWHGCVKYSEGCRNCYVYRRDESVGRDAAQTTRTSMFDLPLKRGRGGDWKIPSGTVVYLCMTSDFLIDRADGWRDEIWDIVRRRSDLLFTVITKRIIRLPECLPADWGNGYDNVGFICTVENQAACDERLPYFTAAPIKRKGIACEPLLSPVDLRKYLTPEIKELVAGGESGSRARVCDYEWILDLKRQCADAGTPFYFKQTGAFFRRGDRIYRVERGLQHSQAKKAKISTAPALGIWHGARGTPQCNGIQLTLD